LNILPAFRVYPLLIEGSIAMPSTPLVSPGLIRRNMRNTGIRFGAIGCCLLAGLAHGQVPDEQLTLRVINQLSVREHGVLALQRPALADRVKLDAKQRAEVQKLVRAWAQAQGRMENDALELKSRKSDFDGKAFAREQIREVAERAGRNAAAAVSLRKTATEEIQSLLTAEQKAAFNRIQPAPLTELRRVPLSPNDGAAAFSPDGRKLAFNNGGKVVLLTLPPGQEAGEELPVKADVKADATRIYAELKRLAFSSDGKTLAAVWMDESRAKRAPEVVYWDVGTKIQTDRVEFQLPQTQPFTPAFSPDLSLVAVLSQKGGISLREGKTGREKGVFGEENSAPSAFRFSPDGKSLFADYGGTYGGTGRIIVWDLQNGKIRHNAHPKPNETADRLIEHVVLTSDGKILVAFHGAGALRFSDLESGQECLSLSRPPRGMARLLVTDDGKTLATIGFSGDVTVWDASDQLELGTFTLKNGAYSLRSAAISPDGRMLALVTTQDTAAQLILLGMP
jgi:Tol biopolymer transport system component